MLDNAQVGAVLQDGACAEDSSMDATPAESAKPSSTYFLDSWAAAVLDLVPK
jgi:hypothetical protein